MNSDAPSLVVPSPNGKYPIFIQEGLLEHFGERFVASFQQTMNYSPSSVVLASDENVFPLYGQSIVSQLEKRSFPVHTLVAKPGETSKSIEVAASWWSRLAEKALDRKAVVIALGGGVVGDLAGFVASTILRGVPVVQIPTSLLAQVDSSVGGKVGINLPEGKNLVGQFWNPKSVWIDPAVLKTLDDENFLAGLGEVVKYAMIADEDFFQWLSDHSVAISAKDPGVISQVITKCCQIKADVVEKDPTETTGLRAILNFGHTAGHAIESVAGYGKVLHGLAVAIGMVVETRLAVEIGICSEQVLNRLKSLLDLLSLPKSVPNGLDLDLLYEAMTRDKKNEGRNVTFMLPGRVGEVRKVVNSDVNLLKKIFSN